MAEKSRGGFDEGFSDGFDIGTTLTVDTTVLELPVNCVMAGQQRLEGSGREWDVRNYRLKGGVSVRRGGTLAGGRPSFSVTQSRRGY